MTEIDNIKLISIHKNIDSYILYIQRIIETLENEIDSIETKKEKFDDIILSEKQEEKYDELSDIQDDVQDNIDKLEEIIENLKLSSESLSNFTSNDYDSI